MVILLMCICSHSRAGFIYDFVCDEPSCGGLTISGTFTLADDTDRSVGAEFGDVEDFDFEWEDKDLVWRLSDQVDLFVIEFSDDFTTISRFCEDEDCFGDQADFTRTDYEPLSVRSDGAAFSSAPLTAGVWRLNQDVQTEDPDTMSVHEPSALPILALSLLGLAARRFKKPS